MYLTKSHVFTINDDDESDLYTAHTYTEQVWTYLQVAVGDQDDDGLSKQ